MLVADYRIRSQSQILQYVWVHVPFIVHSALVAKAQSAMCIAIRNHRNNENDVFAPNMTTTNEIRHGRNRRKIGRRRRSRNITVIHNTFLYSNGSNVKYASKCYGWWIWKTKSSCIIRKWMMEKFSGCVFFIYLCCGNVAILDGWAWLESNGNSCSCVKWMR